LVDIPSMPHLRVVNAFEKLGYRILRQGKHIVMTDGRSIITIPRHNPVNRWTLAGIIKEAGLTVDEFRRHC
jgi:predicted RNA binding protein YcfA (HicA-like mRNA interferase family)